jgi:hypothetical protein
MTSTQLPLDGDSNTKWDNNYVDGNRCCWLPSCGFTVTVIDNQAPAITCPANISVNNTPGTCGAVVTYTFPVGTDNCTGATTANNRTCFRRYIPSWNNNNTFR